MNLITGVFTSQLYFNEQYVEVSWEQSVSKNCVRYTIFTISVPALEYNLYFRQKLYERSRQIMEAESSNHSKQKT